ncbi:MAG: gamma-glutamylcyclotransferase [Gammaproteobacteria bacterium]|nr:gamma-glutamylcyclotransferase [Gammaproteobacteria bacterium]
MVYYLAYGSNLHPLRLLERVPSSRPVGRVELEGFRLAFHKLGQDGSGKCNIVESDNPEDRVHAALYTLAREEKPLLDGFEGAGYSVEYLEVPWQGRRIQAFVYIAEAPYIDDKLAPYHWYKEIVRLGASHLDLPGHYIQYIEEHESIQDPDLERDSKHARLIERILDWPPIMG